MKGETDAPNAGAAPATAIPCAPAMYNPHTLTAMSRWSILTHELPPVDDIKTLHVYDFDNTLFKTPLPNQAIWAGPSLGTLSTQDAFAAGGWWHDSRILAATGEGIEIEEPRAWAGWWNETVVELVQLSTKQSDALCVMLTGRSETAYRDLIRRMLDSKGLHFDLVGLKPSVSPSNQKFSSTMHFKQLFLTALVQTYKGATELRIYEDRPNHVKGFRDFFQDYNAKLGASGPNGPTQSPISVEVIQVAEMATTLNPVIEVAHVQRMVDEHNALVAKARASGLSSRLQKKRLAIKKKVFLTGYLLAPSETERLLEATAHAIPNYCMHNGLRVLANSILISVQSCPQHLLDKVGGLGAKMQWEVTATGSYKDSVWAARVRPIPPNAQYHTSNKDPAIILALRKGAKANDTRGITNWTPLDRKLVIHTVVMEKKELRIDREDASDGETDAGKGPKRKFSLVDSSSYHTPNKEAHTEHQHSVHDVSSSNSTHPSPNRNNNRGRGSHHSSPFNRGGGRGGGGNSSRGGGTPRGSFRQHNRDRGGGGSNRAGAGSAGRSNRGAGGPGSTSFGYRSLDDPTALNSDGQVNYDESQPPRGPAGWAPPQGPAAASTSSRPMGPPQGHSNNIDNYY